MEVISFCRNQLGVKVLHVVSNFISIISICHTLFLLIYSIILNSFHLKFIYPVKLKFRVIFSEYDAGTNITRKK